MERTFTTKLAATEYQEQEIKAGGIAVVGKFGDRFRVYATTKEEIETSIQFWMTKETPEQIKHHKQWHLRDKAREIGTKIDNALELRKLMNDKSIYNDYEFTITAMRIMVEDAKELITAEDVLKFIDKPQDYDKAMTKYSEVVLNDYEYETTPEAVK